jgi:hypothetical protein
MRKNNVLRLVKLDKRAGSKTECPGAGNAQGGGKLTWEVENNCEKC